MTREDVLEIDDDQLDMPASGDDLAIDGGAAMAAETSSGDEMPLTDAPEASESADEVGRPA